MMHCQLPSVYVGSSTRMGIREVTSSRPPVGIFTRQKTLIPGSPTGHRNKIPRTDLFCSKHPVDPIHAERHMLADQCLTLSVLYRTLHAGWLAGWPIDTVALEDAGARVV